MALSFEAIGRLFLVAALGFFLVRRKYLSDIGLSTLTRLMIDIIVPAALMVPMIRNLNADTITKAGPILLVLAIVQPLGVLLTLLYFRVWRTKTPLVDRSADGAAAALAGIMNSFYIPMPLAVAVLPAQYHAEALVLIGVAVLAINPVQWTLGTWLVIGDRAAERRDWRKSLRQILSGPVVGVVGGALLSLVPGLPSAARFEPGSFMPLRMVFEAMDMIGKAMAPLAMLIIGALIAQCELRTSISVRRLIPIVLIRFLIVPGIVYTLLTRDVIPAIGIVGFILMLEAASPPAMNLALAARRFDGEWQVVSGLQLVANLLAVIILPIWMSLALQLISR